MEVFEPDGGVVAELLAQRIDQFDGCGSAGQDGQLLVNPA